MKISKVHPMWPEHYDFMCPNCSGCLKDDMEYEFDDPHTDFKRYRCPYCDQWMKVAAKITIEYVVHPVEEKPA